MNQMLLSLLQTLSDLMAGVFLLRLLMQWARAPFKVTPGPFVLAASNWAVIPLRRVLPGWLGIDWSCVLLAWLMQTLYLTCAVLILKPGAVLSGGVLATVALMGGIETLRVAVYLVFGIVLLMALMSWINPQAPMAPVLNPLAQPFLAPLQRVIPPLGGIDISPLILILILQLLLAWLAGLQVALPG